MIRQSVGDASPLSIGTLAAFSASAVVERGLGVLLAIYLPRYFAGHLGLTLAAVGGAFAVVRLLDIWIDPVLGVLMDRTRTRIGRYRVWMMVGAPTLVIAVGALIAAPVGSDTTYIIIWLLILYAGLSIVQLAAQAWGATLATSYSERSKLFAALAAAGVVGSILVIYAPQIMGTQADVAGQVRAMGTFVMIMAPIAIGIMVVMTPERVSPSVPHANKFALKEYWALITKPAVVRILIADLFLGLGLGAPSALFLFLFTDARGFSGAALSTLIATNTIAGIFGAPATARLALMVGKHRALIVATIGFSLSMASFMVLPKGVLWMHLTSMFFVGFFGVGFALSLRAMLADVGDEVRLEGGRERMSLLYALTTSTQKLSGAFAIGAAFPLLGWLGYNASEGATNTPQAIRWLEIVTLGAPIVFAVTAGLCFLGWKLDARRHAEIRLALDERDRNAAIAEMGANKGVAPNIAKPSEAPGGG